MKTKFILFIIATLIIFDLCYAQKQASYWYFGSEKGLHFTPNSCVADSFLFHNYTKSNFTLSYATISDDEGQLLLYTDGDSLFNKHKKIVKNSKGIFPLEAWEHIFDQPIMFLPNPEYKNIYYLVSSNMEEKPGWGFPMVNDKRNGVRFSIIDIDSDNGNSEVVVKDSVLFFKTCDKLTAVHHANAKDIWVVTHDFGNAVWRTFLLTKDGFSQPPVISIIGDSIGPRLENNDFRTDIKLSPDGQKLIHSRSLYHPIELYKFDDQNGKISNLITFGSNWLNYKSLSWLEFSPDSKKLYATRDSFLYQLDISVFDSAYIENSIKIIGIIPSTHNQRYAQLTTEGKIIIYYENIPYIGIINCPNLEAELCGFELKAKDIILRNKFGNLAYQNFVRSWFKSKDPDTLKAKLWAYPPYCRNGRLNLQALNIPCAKYIWTGPNNFLSTNSSPDIENANPSHSGWYYCHISKCESEFYDSIYVKIYPPPEIKFLSNTGYFKLCPNDSIILSTKDFYIQYKWSTGDTTENTIIRNPGKYYLTITDTNGCKKLDSIIIMLQDNQIKHNEEINLGNVCVGMPANIKDSLTNLGYDTLTLDSIYLLNSKNISLEKIRKFPVKIQQDSNLIYFLKFQPDISGEIYDTLIIIVSKPCYEKLVIPVKCTAYEGFARISLTNVTGEPGNENFCFPVKSKLECNNVEPQFYNIRFKLELKDDFLYYFKTTKGKILNQNYTNDKVTLDIEIDSVNLDEREKVITNICGTLFLANTNYTITEIISPDIAEINTPMIIDNGSISLIGVCSYPIRPIVLFIPIELNIKPNPVNDFLEIFIKSEQDSLTQTMPIEIINILGNCILMSRIPLLTTFKLDVSNLPTGVYFIKAGTVIKQFIKL